MPRASSIAFIALLLCCPAHAAEPETAPTDNSKTVYEMDLSELMNVVVTTPGRTQSRIEEAPGSVTVITKEQIADINAQSLRDVLSVYVPGVDSIPTYYSYGDAQNDATYARGLFSDWSQQTLILINGRSKVIDSTWGFPGISLYMPLENIERIEISRSPVPLYGGGAFFIINMITKEQTMHGVQGSSTIGITGRDSGQTGPESKRVSLVTGLDLTDYLHAGLALHYFDEVGQPAPVGKPGADGRGGFSLPAQQMRNGTQNSLHASFTLNTRDNVWNFETFFAGTRRDPYTTGGVSSPSLGLYYETAAYWFANLTYRPLPELSIVASMQTNLWSASYFYAVPSSNGDRGWDAFVDATYNLHFEAGGKHNAVVGLRLEREGQYDSWTSRWDQDDTHAGFIEDHSAATGAYGPNLSRNVLGVYVEDTYKPLDELGITAGVRYDLMGGFVHTDHIVNPRGAIVWSPGAGFVLKAQYSSASRAPSLFERTGINCLPLFGTSDIKPEHVIAGELSALYRADSFKIQLTGFFQRFDDRIQYLNDGSGNFYARNAGNDNIPGGDLEFWYFFNPRTYAFLNGTYMHAADAKTGQRTNYIPSTYINAGLNWNSNALGIAGLDDKININVTGYYRDLRRPPPGLPINSSLATKNSFRGSASLTYRFLPAARAYVTLDNFTDERTRIPLSYDNLTYTMSGRSVLVGLVVGLDSFDAGRTSPSLIGDHAAQ